VDKRPSHNRGGLFFILRLEIGERQIF